uniref:hypothetical protein n=1 Tax=Herbidospora sakaeratensis TaxID=564415 RepID=UPI0012FB7422|nr:hypothetical protein [Herbidospora sakaeratensis]
MNDVPQFATVVKPSDESVSSSTTLQNDDHLILSLPTNSTFIMDAMIIYLSPGNADFKGAWSGPSGATLQWFTDAGSSAETVGVHAVNRIVYQISETTSILAPGLDPFLMCYKPKGILTTGGSNGNLTFRWAQATSQASAAVAKAGSWIRLHKIA